MSDESVKVGVVELGPLAELVEQGRDNRVRVAALDAIPRFQLDEPAWRHFAGVVRGVVTHEPSGSPVRHKAIEVGMQVPLRSMREQLRALSMLEDPDAEVARQALELAGDFSRAKPLLAQLRAGRAPRNAHESLARMPIERIGIVPEDIPKLDREHADPDAWLWTTLALARLGEFGPLDELLRDVDRNPPPLFWGDPWRSYDALAGIRPVPRWMQEHLAAKLPELGDRPYAQRIAGAVTGLAGVFGDALEPRPPLVRRVAGSMGGSTPRQLGFFARRGLVQRLLSGEISESDRATLRGLPARELNAILRQIVERANRRARELSGDTPANVVLGNAIIDVLPDSSVLIPDLPVEDLLRAQVAEQRPALDDDQMGYVIAHERPGRLIAVTRDLARQMGDDAPRVIVIAGHAGDYQSGRGGSPMRGSGGGEGARGRIVIVDDLNEPTPPPGYVGYGVDVYSSTGDAPPEAAPPPAARGPIREAAAMPPPMASPAPASQSPPKMAKPPGAPPPAAKPAKEEEPPSSGATPPLEERRVHAQVKHGGKQRNSFVAGGEHEIRLTIALEGEAPGSAANEPVQGGIPASGAHLDVELQWEDQLQKGPMFLPGDPTLPSSPVKLGLSVPAGTAFVSADVLFMFRGRVFEWVKVEAPVRAPGEAEQPGDEVKVKVQARRRQVVGLEDSINVDGAIIAGDGAIRVFGAQGKRDYRLEYSADAREWFHNALFVAASSLVITKPGPDGKPELDAGSEQLLTLLRPMARHGTVMYKSLVANGFVDPGERLQVLSRDAGKYVPLEFVYDLGSPLPDAKLCAEGVAALRSDASRCPRCSKLELTADQRTKMPTVCPLGFWSLQKIIERVESESEAATTAKRHLAPLDTALFASSSIVPEKQIEATWEAIEKVFDQPRRADDWEKWKEALAPPQTPIPLLITMPHHGERDEIDYLQIGADDLPAALGQLGRDQLDRIYVNPQGSEPGPLLLLLGCRTGTQKKDGYGQLAAQFRKLQASIVVGTTAEVLGEHAAPVAREFVSQLAGIAEPETDFGRIMRRTRRRMLANGYVMSLALVALGDAEWRLSPRAH